MPFRPKWNISYGLSYGQSYTGTGGSLERNFGANVVFSLPLTVNWSFSTSASYDLINRKIIIPELDVHRDLHCWIMDFSYRPPGSPISGFNLTIRIKAPQLQDIKLHGRKIIMGNFEERGSGVDCGLSGGEEMQSHSFYNRYPIADTRAPIVAKTRERLKHLGVSGDSRLLVAVSGGPDSLALTHVLQSMRRSGAFGEMTVAHVNHGIRKEAAQLEEEVVREYCRNWNVPIEVKRMDTMNVAKREKKGIEETARKQRYAFFEELVQTHGFDFVLTAHTANDQAETVLMHLVRGAGVRGLAGIPPKRKLGSAWLLRPWLSIHEEEILEYVQNSHLTPMHDASNDDLSFHATACGIR